MSNPNTPWLAYWRAVESEAQFLEALRVESAAASADPLRWLLSVRP